MSKLLEGLTEAVGLMEDPRRTLIFTPIREGRIELIKRELTVVNSARVQTTTWIRFIKGEGPTGPRVAKLPFDRVEKAFNSRMTIV